jgi:hypothetical protein
MQLYTAVLDGTSEINYNKQNTTLQYKIPRIQKVCQIVLEPTYVEPE